MSKNHIRIVPSEDIKAALKRLDEAGSKVLCVVDAQDKLLGCLSDGDIRRHLLNEGKLTDSIEHVYNKKPLTIGLAERDEDALKELFLKSHYELIPVVNEEGVWVDTVFWSDVFARKTQARWEHADKVSLPVVIMAGGRGVRMQPFTNVLPKPLLPVGDSTLIEKVMQTYANQGCSQFYVTLNYKGAMLEAYFKGMEHDYDIRCVYEEDFFGTAGALKLVGPVADTFLVSNCDILVDTHYADVLKHHHQQKADLTILSSIQHYQIPYGVLHYEKGGALTSIEEKPEYSMAVNTGVYVLNKEALDFIPEKTKFDMTDLIATLMQKGRKVVTYPVNSKDYLDFGQWDDYHKTVAYLQGERRS